MRLIKGFIDIYKAYLKAFFKTQTEYRTSFITGIFANAFCYFITFMSFWVLTENFQDIGEWSFHEITILYGINLLSYATAGMFFWGSILCLEDLIVMGDLDRYILRPFGLIQQMAFTEFGWTFIGQIIIAGFFLIKAYINLDLISVFSIIFTLYIIIGSVLMQSAAMIFFGSLSFWTTKSMEISELIYYDLRRFTEYPLNIYPKQICFILTFIIPWALISYFPSCILLSKNNTTFVTVMGHIAPCIGAALFVFSIAFFYRGIRRYAGTGN